MTLIEIHQSNVGGFYGSMMSSARSLVQLFAWHPCSSMTHGLLPAGATGFDITISPHWFIPGRTFRPESLCEASLDWVLFWYLSLRFHLC